MPRANPLRWSRKAQVAAVAIAIVAAGSTAFASTLWVVSLASGSSAQSQSATISNISIAAVASPSATNLLYPGGNGDVVATITNPNPYPVTVTGVTVPSQSSMATGYANSNLTGAVAACSSSTSDVYWQGAPASGTQAETFSKGTFPLIVAASGTLTVTFLNDAFMTTSAPAACAGIYFQMPSLSAVAATGGAATATSSPATSGW